MVVKRFRASAHLKSGKTVRLSSRQAEFTISRLKTEESEDESVRLQITPGELLLQALGSCLLLTGEAWAEKKGIKLKSFDLDLVGEVDGTGSKGKIDSASLGLSRILTTFYIDADNSDAEIEDFISFICENCPIHASLSHAPQFENTIVIKESGQ